MHFYPHNIADFNNATRHLTRVQRSVYRDAIDRYYDKEQALDGSDFAKLCRVLLCVTDEEISGLSIVLDEFFVLVDGNYTHDRCDLEIEKYRSNTTAKAKAGKASAEARKNKRVTPVEHTLNSVEQTNNQELITNNQETVTKSKELKDIKQDSPAKKSKAVKTELDYSVWPQEPDKQVFEDWIAMRKAKKGSFSQTVIDGFGAEFRQAITFGYSVNDCLRAAIMSNWTGFKFNWLQNQNAGGQNATNQRANGFGNGKEKINHADRVRAQGKLAIQRIDQEAGNDVIHPTGGLIWEQGGHSELDNLF
jgi:uncharacterized protein YdaU (DUF1376 family)